MDDGAVADVMTMTTRSGGALTRYVSSRLIRPSSLDQPPFITGPERASECRGLEMRAVNTDSHSQPRWRHGHETRRVDELPCEAEVGRKSWPLDAARRRAERVHAAVRWWSLRLVPTVYVGQSFCLRSSTVQFTRTSSLKEYTWQKTTSPDGVVASTL